MYLHKGKEVKICEGIKCIHRFRCYRHSLYQDSIFKGMKIGAEGMIVADTCINPEDEDIPGYTFMWLPDVEK